MAEARGPSHLLEVCNQKFSEFLFNVEHKSLVWLREIEEEALKMFDSNFSAEPELMPRTPSQKKLRKKKKRSSSFRDENKELTRKRLSGRQSHIKPTSFQRLSQNKDGLNNLVWVAASNLKTSPLAEEASGFQCDRTAVLPTAGGVLGTHCSQNIELKTKGMSGIPEIFTVCSVDGTGDTETAGRTNGSALLVPGTVGPAKTERDWDASRLINTSTPKASLDGKSTCGEEELPPPNPNNSLVQEEFPHDLRESAEISGASQLGRPPVSRPHKSRRMSLAKRYSLTHKRQSIIRKSISRTIAKKKAAQDSSSASSQVSCCSSLEVFLDDEISKHGPLIRNAESSEVLNVQQKLDSPNPVVSCAVEMMEQGEVYSKGILETKITDSQVNGSEDPTQNHCLHGQLQNSRRQSYKRALDEVPADQHAQDEGYSLSDNKTPPPLVNKVLPTSGSAKIKQPFKNFFQTMQKSPLLKSPGPTGHTSGMKSFIKRNTRSRPDSKGDFVEKERQRLENLRKKQEAEQQRKQKVEEEKRLRLEEIRLKREERLRKALQARERLEQIEEEKRKRMEQKLSQHEERIEKVREEEKTKKKISAKKMGEVETRKQKVQQMEEEPKREEQPEKWKTVGEIKKMLEHNSSKQEKERVHRQQDKEKWVKPLGVVSEEEENLKEECSLACLGQLQQGNKAEQVEVVPAASKWLNITAQKSPVDSPSQVSPQDLKDTKSLKVNLNDYGMDLNSDDSTDDESQPRKPIPPWASGLQLNEAVTYQYYNPPDINLMFGLILSPKLEDIFYKSKPRYFKRTSSAVWQSPPDPKTALHASNSMKI
ncbi:inner centromere protein A-like isoform X2 [Hemicordylus capensis]|nr:inner centromere protein A-like isoform X2 [Hemicordylus capensis]XP_053140502.1 inner centromere protein A-like isoform X2 [Hemicordylus capensis]